MPVTIKKSQLLYKDTSTGTYVSVDAVADKTSEQQINGIQVAANNAIGAINDALDDISTEPLTELPKKAYKNDLTTNTESLGSSASKAYSIGDYFYVSDNENDRSLYKVTADIASGDTISAGTAASNNCIPAALAEDVNALSNDLDNIKGDLNDYADSVILKKNLISEILVGKYTRVVGTKVVLTDDETRSCVIIPVKGEKYYAINATFSSNFSMWGEKLLDGTIAHISNITPNNELVYLSPQNANVLCISNTGWNSDIDLVIMESKSSIIGFSKVDYPFDIVVSVSIPLLEQAKTLDDKIIAYDNVIHMFKNMVGNIVSGKYARNASGNIIISDDENRGYVKLEVIGGRSYAISAPVSSNFSMWGYSENDVDKTISLLSSLPADLVITAPENASVLYLSNTGWNSDTDLVVLETDYSIIGYSKDDYPFDTAVVTIPTFKTTEKQDQDIAEIAKEAFSPIENIVSEYQEEVILSKNLVHVINQGQYSRNVNNKVVISEDANRSYVQIPVKTGHTYAVNCQFSGNFSIWAYHQDEIEQDSTISLVSPVPSDYVITAPENANMLYLSNTGWNSDTDLVVMESENSIVGYSKDDYPFGAIASVIIPKLKIQSLEEDKLPDYYYENDYFPNLLHETQEAMNFANGVCFAFITDVHFPTNQEKSRIMLREIIQKTTVPFCIYGGDTPALFGGMDQLDYACKTLISYVEAVGRENWFAVRGNHDLYCRTNETPSVWSSKNNKEIYNIMARTSERYVTNMLPEHMCYCLDIPSQKCRFVMLNTSDLDEPNGGAKATAAQAAWLADVLTNVNNTNIIVIAHIPSDQEISTDAPILSNYQSLLKAFHTKTSVSVYDTEYSFSGTTNNLICIINGHMHDDIYHNDNGVLSISTTCDAAYYDDGYGMAKDTINEQAFDVYFIDFDNHTIKTIRYGRGSNRAWNYLQGVEINE